MRTRLITFLLAAIGFSLWFATPSVAQRPIVSKDSTWRFSGNASLTFSQVALSNWVAGGQNSLSGEAAAFLSLEHMKGRSAWTNTLDLGFGITKLGEDGLVKHLDKFDFASKYGYQAYKAWYYSALFSLKTQFAAGYKYPDRNNKISDFLSPLYGTLALGADYKPNDKFSMLLSPLTGRMIYVGAPSLSAIGAFGVKPNEHVKWELGGLVRATYRDVFLNGQLGLLTKLELFSNYLEKPQNIDVSFDVLLDYKLNDFLTAKFQLTMLYDDDQKVPQANGTMAPKLQVREMFGIGLAYRF